MRSSTYRCGTGCINRNPPPSGSGCCQHTGHEYGWRPGPHTVPPKNTAATGKCDTFGNMAFKSTAGYLNDNVSELSSVSPQKLEDLEALILEEHEARLRAEQDLAELKDIEAAGTQDQYKSVKKLQVDVSEDDLNELLQDVKLVVDRPLNQTNIDCLRRLLVRQEEQQRLREYNASKGKK
ncbi:hypothetical protein STCU_02579 [Strigomonas culicis]|nr:hypothetical protein STCU_02579 [Strigomonas culicis]|eukprot:EPY32914.1 hypothetical protein STCU_02579 [Strigomonas culicis]